MKRSLWLLVVALLIIPLMGSAACKKENAEEAPPATVGE